VTVQGFVSKILRITILIGGCFVFQLAVLSFSDRSLMFGDDYLVVKHFSNLSYREILELGVSETGQGKWRPLTYLTIALMSNVCGFSQMRWIAVSAIMIALLIWVFYTVAKHVQRTFGKLSTRILVISLVFILFEPSTWYNFGSPFAIMEVGAACCLLLGVLKLVESSSACGPKVVVPSLWLIGAVLFHERYLVPVLTILIILLLWSRDLKYRRTKFLERVSERRNHSIETYDNNSLNAQYFRFQSVLLSTHTLIYIYSRTSLEGSSLLTTGGLRGVSAWSFDWIALRPLWWIFFMTSGSGQVWIFDPLESYALPSNIARLGIALLGFSLVMIALTIVALNRSAIRRICADKTILLSLAAFLSLGIPSSLVAEWLEPRWWWSTRLVVVLLIFWSVDLAMNKNSDLVRNRKLAVKSPVRHLLLGVIAIVCVASSSALGWLDLKSFYGLRQDSAAAFKDGLEIGELRPEDHLVLLRSEIYSEDVLQWFFGYGGVFREFSELNVVIAESGCEKGVECSEVLVGAKKDE